jgi:hypothetical protein
MSVPTVDEDAWRILEPGTAHPLQRLRAVRELVDAGRQRRRPHGADRSRLLLVAIQARTNDQAIADHGARFVGCNVMYLQDGTRTHFLKFIEREFPSMTRGSSGSTREISARGVSQGSQRDGPRAAAALRAHSE